MKTRLLENLTQTPVEFCGRRRNTHRVPPLAVTETSKIVTDRANKREVYRLRADFGALFTRLPHQPEAERLLAYRELLASVADGVYGEVRSEVRKLLPMLVEIDNFELRTEIEEVVINVLAMTQVEL